MTDHTPLPFVLGYLSQRAPERYTFYRKNRRLSVLLVGIKVACYLLFLVSGVFVTAANDATGQTLPQLTLLKSTTAENAVPGEGLVYNLTYFNGGPGDATTVLLTEQIPDYTLYVGTESTGWHCTPDNRAGATCIYSVGTVVTGGGGQVEFPLQVAPSVPAGVAAIHNRATIGAADEAELATAETDTVLVATPDLEVSNIDHGAVAPGESIVYLLTYRNGGNQDATGVVLTATLPAYTTFDSTTSSAGWDCTETTCHFPVGALAVGAQASVDFALMVTNSLPIDITAIEQLVTIVDDGANGVDPTPGNNQATVTTPLNHLYQIVATKVDSLLIDADEDSVPSPGDTLEYLITIRSDGNATAHAVTLRDTLDPNTELVPGVQSSQGVVTVGNTEGDTQVEVALGEMAGNGATATLRFQARIKATLPLAVTSVQNQGIVSSPDFADVPTDDPDTDAAGDATHTPLHAFAQLYATLIDYLFVDSDGNEVVSVGDILIYRLTLVNHGNGAAGGITIVDHPNAGLQLISGSVATGLGEVLQGNDSGAATMRVAIPLLPANASVLVTYKMRIAAGAQGVTATQAAIAVQSGLAENSGSLTTDDPDIVGTANATVTPLGSTLVKLAMNFLPLIIRVN